MIVQIIPQLLRYLEDNDFLINSKFELETYVSSNYYQLYSESDDGRISYKYFSERDVESIDLHFENSTAFITFFGDE